MTSRLKYGIIGYMDKNKHYLFLINNFNYITKKQFWYLYKLIYLEELALFLKNKFNDKRTIDSLVKVIIEEYKLPIKYPYVK